MADNPQQQPLPTMQPQQVAQLTSLFPQQGGAAPTQAPPTAQPPSGGAGGMQDYAELAKQQQAQLQASPATKEAAGAREQMTSLAGEAAGMPLPKTGWLDTQGKPQQGGFLHNLGRALMAIGGATTIGQDIQAQQYGPGVREYRTKQAGYAERIKAAQERAEGAEKQVGAEAQVTGRTIMGGARTEAATITSQQKAEQARQQFTVNMDKIEQNAQALKIKGDALNALKTYRTAYLQSFDRRTQANEDVAMAMVGAKQDAAAASNIDKYMEVHPILNMLGIGPEPVAPAGGRTTPGSATRVAPGAGKPVPKGTVVYDPKGIAHNSDGTHPLPKGWSLQKPQKSGK